MTYIRLHSNKVSSTSANVDKEKRKVTTLMTPNVDNSVKLMNVKYECEK